MSTIKLTRGLLNKIIQEEVMKFKADAPAKKDAKETEPGDLADTLAKKVEFAEALKIEEKKLLNKLKKIREARIRTLKKIVNTK